MSASYTAVRQHIDELGPKIVQNFLMRAALGDTTAQAKLLPFMLPKADRDQRPVSVEMEIDLSTQSAARDSLARIATKIGTRELGLEEGVTLLDAVGRALERLSVLDVGELQTRMEELERTAGQQSTVNTRVALSRANGSTPKWGKIEHHPSLTQSED